MSSKVYFTDMRAKKGSNLMDKLERLYDSCEFAQIVDSGDLVAIKIHFGERGNTAYIRPPFLKILVEKIKKANAKPFLTDTNTLYAGSRQNAVDHLKTAVENGFAYAVVGAPLIIADGLNGKDYLKVNISGKHFKEVNIGSALYHADSLLTVSHFKGHELTGFGGALKNLGMGSGSRSGKQMMHSDVLPAIDSQKCKVCGRCLEWCPGDAIILSENHAQILDKKCLGCGECIVTCPHGAIEISWKTQPRTIQEKMVEYALGVLKNKNQKTGFINFVINVTPDCDCSSWSDAPIVADVGILASRDPVAVDQASFDLVNQQDVLPQSCLGKKQNITDKFYALHQIDSTAQLAYAESLGLGTRSYKLIKI